MRKHAYFVLPYCRAKTLGTSYQWVFEDDEI